MWNWWKKLLNRLETDKEEIEELPEPSTIDNRNNKIHTRVTYQYPSKARFRFPVIPDEEEKKEVRTHRVKQVKTENREIRKGRYEPGHLPNKTEKKPFVPTPVASPIYGYQKRDKEVETVPAFIRKREEKERTPLMNQTAETPVSFKPLKKVNEAPVFQIKEVVPTQPQPSTMESNVVHIENYESKMKTTSLREEEKVTSLPASEIASTVDKTDESLIAIEERDAITNQREGMTELPTEMTEQETRGEPNLKEDGIHSIEQVQAEVQPIERVIDQSFEDTSIKEQNEMIDESANDKPEKIVESFQQQNQHTDEISKEEHPDQRHQFKHKPEIEDQKREQPIPFNVMMTPQDKLLLKLKREKKEKEEKRRKTFESKKDIYIPQHLLNDPVQNSSEDERWLREQQELLEKTLKYFNVRAKVVNVTQGPTVTRFEVQPELGVKVSKVKNLSDDIKLNMSAKDIRIEAPIPGKNTIGIEVPNLNSHMVGLQEIFETDDFKKNKSPLTIGLGLSVEGLPIVSDIAKMPHGLIAGATGSGKSVCINTILLSILYKANYNDVKLLLIDPKMVELAPYNGLPHLVTPVITDVKAATSALKWAVEEMEERYEKFVQEGVRDIGRYNKKIKEQHRHDEKMPYIVIVIDELADLMMASPQDVEDSICRIAQKARACGIHLLLATQRPSVDVITGLIKANIPTRIAFSVSSQVDSRTIIDMNGAERLLGKGDMLFIENGASKSIRLQGAFVSDEEIERITNYVRKLAPPQYLFEQEQLIQMEMSEEEDELLDEVIQFVMRQNQASTSLLQRQFRIGYNRAARLIDTLEGRGIISGQNGSKPRDVLLSKTQVEEMYPL